MAKAVLTSNVLEVDTIVSVAEPVTVRATTATGAVLIVPADTPVGSFAILGATGAYEEGTNLFFPGAAGITLIP